MIKLVLLRHGQSTWNKENRFTGWTDVPLTKQGIGEAKKAGKILKENKFKFDIVFTNVHKRAIDTTKIVLKEMKIAKIPIIKAWQFNERHYGALQGLNKSETAQKYGEEQVLIWRRSYAICPPELTKDDPRYPGHDPRYQDIPLKELPLTESLDSTVKRFVPYWANEIAKQVKTGKKVLIAAHGNSLRALVKHLDQMSEEEILKLNIPTGIPLVYELNRQLKPVKHYYLGDQAKIEKAMAAVANQGKK